jgi:hypothetical protein
MLQTKNLLFWKITKRRDAPRPLRGCKRRNEEHRGPGTARLAHWLNANC